MRFKTVIDNFNQINIIHEEYYVMWVSTSRHAYKTNCIRCDSRIHVLGPVYETILDRCIFTDANSNNQLIVIHLFASLVLL